MTGRNVTFFVFCLTLTWTPARAAADQGRLRQPEVASIGTPESKTHKERPNAASSSESDKVLSPQMASLRSRLRQVLDRYYLRPLNSRDNGQWSIMHAAIGYGIDAEIAVGGPDGPRANAIAWLCYNRPCHGHPMLSLRDGLPQIPIGPGRQGHEGQLLSVLAQARVPRDYMLRAGARQMTVASLIEAEKRSCKPHSELTFKLIGLAHYLDSDATWTSQSGNSWSIPRMIRDELSQPVTRGACCGGTHRLMGLSHAVRIRQSRDEPLDGQWLRAQQYVQAYQKYALRLQNRDGSFSTNWLRGRGDSGNMDRKLETTGHIVEWLVLSLPQDRLDDPRIVRAVGFLVKVLDDHPEHQWYIGYLGHALHGLTLYEQRVFDGRPGDRHERLARKRGQSVR